MKLILMTYEEAVAKVGREPSAKAKPTVAKYLAWRDSKSYEDFLQIEKYGVLNKSDIEAQIADEQETTFPRSNFRSNDWLAVLHENLESVLREKGILPGKTESQVQEDLKGAKDNPKNFNKNKRKAAQDAQRLSELQELVLQQKARISELEKLLEERLNTNNIYADLAEFGIQFGSK